MVNRVYDRDQPVDGSQEKPDQLNRQDFAKHLAEIIHIKPDEDCLTVSVEGEWGSGKSSVLAMVKRHLKAQENPPIIIEFNPWLIGDVDSLVQKFLVQFSAQLDIPDRPKETLRVAQELLSYSKLFDVVKLIPGAEPWASVFKSVISGVGSATGKIGKLKELDIHGRKIKVKNAVERLGVSIVVIIDDIDRLTPAEAFEVIKLSKAVADFKGVTFVLAFDQEYLAAALESNNIHNSNQFIEKIVQLRIPLPLVSIYDMHDLSNKYMDDLSENNLLEKYSDDERRLSEVYFKSARYLIRTPRDLKRIMNHLRFVLIQTAGEVCFTDLYLLSVLAIVCPDIYQSIKDNPWAYIGMGFDDQLRYEKSEDIVKKEKEYVEGKISNQPEKNRKLIRNILNDLFPLVYEDKFSSYSSDFDKSGRVASIKRLSVALHYQVPGNMTSDNETVMFINGEIDRIKHIESVIDRGSSDRFFEILSNQIDMVTKNAKDLLPVLFENIINSNKVKDNEKNYGGFFNAGSYRRLLWISFDIFKNNKNSYDLIRVLFENQDYLTVTADILYRLQVQYGEMKTDDPFLREEKWVAEDEFLKLKSLWVSTAIRGLSNGGVFECPDVIKVYYRLLRLDPEALKRILAGWLDEDGGLKKIANLIGKTGSSSNGGDFSHVNLDDLSDVFDVDKLKKLAQSELETNKGLDLYYRSVYKSILTGKRYFLNDGSEADGSW